MGTINPKDFLLFSNHYRPSMFFEDSLHRLLDAGFPAVVQHTGGDSSYPKMSLRHSNILYYKEIPSTSYDGGMMEWRRSDLLNKFGAQYIVHIDNDLFLSGTEEFCEYLTQFVEQDFDFVGHLVSQATCNRYNYNGQLALVDDLVVKPASSPGDVACPEPHWETSYMILKLSLWNRLTVEDVGHMRRFVIAMHQLGARMGSHKATYQWDYSAWGKEWFHLGHIIEKYSKLESTQPFTYGPDSSFDKFRVGWLILHEEIYPESNIFAMVRPRLQELINYFGGKEIVMKYFYEIAKNTCLDGWKKYG